MVPVELRISNFLSYGPDTPPLDFASFRVACLSGRNGQGKSALLDAITWALWGEARKSSGSHKPDEELLRIGASRMRVELVFDIESTRYRVLRGYARSASGKTSKPELELHILGENPDQGRPLTRASVRETQDLLDELLGLNYQTFINSAFLLQGRSDEFTKKRPNERKEILARILNLEAYERLALAARDREREFADRLLRLQESSSRLLHELEQEETCRQEFEALQVEIEAGTRDLVAAEAAEADTQRLLAEHESRAHTCETLRESIRRLSGERAHLQATNAALEQQIAEADGLIQQAPTIEAAYERYQRLQLERDEMDTRRDLHRGIEKLIERTTNTLRETIAGLEKRLHAFEVESRTLRASRVDMEGQLIELPALTERLTRARAAVKDYERLMRRQEAREKLQERIQALEQALLARREELLAEQRQLAKQLGERNTLQRERIRVDAECDRLRIDRTRKQEFDQLLETLQRDGQAIAEAIKQKEGGMDGLAAEVQRLLEKRATLAEVVGGDCPTCGQTLTEAHRDAALTGYDAERTALEMELETARNWMGEEKRRLETLRARFVETRSARDALANVPERLATAEAQRDRLGRELEALDVIEDRLALIARQIEKQAYGEVERSRLDEALAERDALGIDEAAIEEARTQRARLQQYEERHRALLELEARHAADGEREARISRELAAVRAELDGGPALVAHQQELERLRVQLAGIGFDAERFDVIRAELRELGQAGIVFKALADARAGQPARLEQHTTTLKRITSAVEETAALTAQLVSLEEQLGDLKQVQSEAAERRRRRESLAAQLRERDVRSGTLRARLDQFTRDRTELQAVREEQQEAEHERMLFGHLRSAFGKNGIPSLIIEETLPEIETRANDLLDRLTDGRMRMRLETLKDKKSGGTRETLEIILTDEQGAARPYETFSGGEAFRVNFALRIALSQLLAERQGVRIRTLGIDEGFGTQDEQGIQHLIEAIHAIQDDFDKILVITHLDVLKEAFPVRIEVEKHPVLGSRFQVIGV